VRGGGARQYGAARSAMVRYGACAAKMRDTLICHASPFVTPLLPMPPILFSLDISADRRCFLAAAAAFAAAAAADVFSYAAAAASPPMPPFFRHDTLPPDAAAAITPPPPMITAIYAAIAIPLFMLIAMPPC